MSDPDVNRWMPGAEGKPIHRFDDSDVEVLAQVLHGAAPEIERKLLGAQSGFIASWETAAPLTKEGRRLQARYLLERNLVFLDALRAR